LVVVALRTSEFAVKSRNLILFVSISVILAVVSFPLSARVGRWKATPGGVMRSQKPRAWFAVSLLFVGLYLAPDLFRLVSLVGSGGASNADRRPNVLLIVMDAVRCDSVSGCGGLPDATPNIAEFAREATTFSRAFAAAPWTLPSHASLFTGLYPYEHGATWEHRKLDSSFRTLAEHLRERGYQCVGITENPSTGFQFGLAQGFGAYYEMWRKPLVIRAVNKVRRELFQRHETREYTERTVTLLKRWISERRDRGEPFFMFVNFMAGHLPNYEREGFTAGDFGVEELKRIQPVNLVPELHYVPEYKLSDRELGMMRTLYEGDIRYLDREMGDLFRFLRESNILEETVVIVTSDHGENFGDHGLIEHQFSVHNSLIHVPLLIRFPPRFSPGRVDYTVSNTAVFWTVLDLVGGDGGGPGWENRRLSLADIASDQMVISEFKNAISMLRRVLGDDVRHVDLRAFDKELKCVIHDGQKFIWSSNGEHELYDVRNDFNELSNLYEPGTEWPTSAGSHLFRLLEEARTSSGGDEDEPVLDPETRSELEALGYVK
jgi:arylsulfatase A-like enzyme